MNKQTALDSYSNALGDLISAAAESMDPSERELVDKALAGGAYLSVTSRIGVGHTSLECILHGLHGERAMIFSVNDGLSS